MNSKPVEKFRILMLVEKYPPVYSGAGQQAYYLSKSLANRGHQITVLAQHKNGLQKKERQDGFKVVRLKSLGGRVLFSYLFGIKAALWLLARFKHYDILHVHGINLWGLPAMLIARLTGTKIVAKMTLLGEDDPQGLEKMKFGRLRKKVYIFPHKVIALTQAQFEQYQRSEFADHRIIQIPNGVDLTRFFPVTADSKTNLRQKLSLPIDKPIVLFVGKISIRKGVPLLIDVWANHLKNKNIVLCLLGPEHLEQSYSNEVRAQIKKSGLENRIMMIGAQKNGVEFLQAADLFVLPSIREGLPNSLLEAMACGLPAIVADRPEYCSLFQTDPAILKIIANIDAVSLAQAVVTMIKPETREELGKRAHHFVANHLSIEQIAQRYEMLYRQLHQNRKK